MTTLVRMVRVAGTGALFVVFTALTASPAVAAPQLGVSLKNDANEVQQLTVKAVAGSYNLKFGDDTTAAAATGDLAGGTRTGDVTRTPDSSYTRAAGSPILTNVTNIASFHVGMLVTGTGIPAGSRIIGIADTSLTLDTNASSSGSASNLVGGAVLNASGGPFTVDQGLGGPGIPASTTILAVTGSTVTPSALPVSTTADAALSTGSFTVANLVPVTGTLVVGGAISGSGIQPGTTITACAPAPTPPEVTCTAPTSLTLSAPPSVAQTSAALVGAIPFNASTAVLSGVLNALPSVAAGGGAVSVSGGPGGQNPYQIFFGAGPLAGTDVPAMKALTKDLTGRVLVTTLEPGGIRRSDERVDYTATVTNTGPDPTDGSPVTLEIQLPGGQQTYVFQIVSASGWSCSTQPAAGAQAARALCGRTSVLSPGSSYPPVTVAARLGADAPDQAVATATASGGGSPAPGIDTDGFEFAPALPFGLAAFAAGVSDQAGNDYTQAGGHPFSAFASFSFNLYRYLNPSTTPAVGALEKHRPVSRVKNVITDTPRGFVGNALAVPELCPTTDDLLVGPGGTITCPPTSAVGGIELYLRGTCAQCGPFTVYSIVPDFGSPAQFAFVEPNSQTLYTFAPRLRAEDGYAIRIESRGIVGAPELRAVNEVTLCSFGAKVNASRTFFTGCKEAGEPGANPKPLVTAPTRCTGPPPTATLLVESWEEPGVFSSRTSTDPMPTNCELVDFEPEIELQPTSSQAGSPTGLDVELTMPTEGLESPTGIAQATMKRVKVAFPEGMSVNASAGHGLGACSSAQVGINPSTGVPNDAEANCPGSSKIGTIAIETPLIEERLTGEVFIAKQGDHPFETPIALYMVFSSKKDGITIKIAGKVETHPVTGQMTVTFDNNPEQPFSKVELHFPQGSRANLTNPPRCGAYEITAELTPWSALDPDNPTPEETVVQRSAYHVNEGPNGGPCPRLALEPHLSAGVGNPAAGAKSPFLLRLSREDGTQRFTALDVATPPGLVASLRGVPYCPDSVLAAISPAPETGQAQIDNPSCPAASLIGTARAGAGAGPNPLFVDTGRVYLAGPYKGAPLSIAVVTPAVAGPLDLGNVVIRSAIHVDPVTARITAVSDPIPTILHGILLDIRDIRVAMDRPGFTQNPTSCEPLSVDATVAGERGASAARSNRFQVGECAALGFKPDVTLRLVGGTKRGGHPSLRAVVRPRPGDANIRRAAVALPRSAFLDQANIRTICTRVQWAADNCPKAARYGFARAWSPLLDQPLQGPVYLRSSDNLLPDLVVDLRGPAHQPIRIEAAFRTDSVRGGIRSTIDFAPDAPVSRFLLRMQGGKRKGLIVNSRDICQGTNRATSRMNAHNGRRSNTRPKVHAANCGKARKGKGGKGTARVHRMKAVGR